MSHLFHAYTSPSDLATTSSGGYNVPKESLDNEFGAMHWNRVTASSAIPGTMFSTENSEIILPVPKSTMQMYNKHIELPLTNNHAVAATPKAYSFTGYVADHVTATAAASGYFRFEDHMRKCRTADLLFSTSAANIQVALRAMHKDYALVTATGTAATFNAAAIVVTGVASLRDFQLTFVNLGLASAVPVPLLVDSVVSTAWAVGGSLVIGPSPIVLSTVEYRINGKKFEEYPGEYAFRYISTHYTEAELKCEEKKMGYDFETKRSTNFIDGNGGTLTLRIPLIGALADSGQILPYLLPNAEFSIRVVLRGNTASIFAPDSGSTATFANLVVGTPQLAINSKTFDPKHIGREIGKSRTVLLHEVKSYPIESSVTPTAATERNILINASGPFTDMWFEFRPNTKASSDTWLNPVELNSIDIRDVNGTHMIGDDAAVTDYDMRRVLLPDRFKEMNMKVLDDYNLYAWIPSTNPREAKFKGKIMGAWTTDTNKHRLYYTPTATSAAGHEMVCYMTTIKSLTINPDGNFTILG